MDTSDPKIHFDEDGICNHCTDFKNIRSKYQYSGDLSDAEFLRLVSEIKAKGKGRKYDCILGLSGGVDSSYAAYIAKQNGIRVLAVHVDNGWNSEEAVLNIKNISQILDIPYESFVLNWQEFRQIQLAFLKASVPEADTPFDMAIPGALNKVASKYGVRTILSGGNFATEGILPAHWHYNARDLRYFNSIITQFSTGRISSFPKFGLLHESYYKFIRGVKNIYILNYVHFNKDEAVQLLEQKLGWRYYGGKHYESVYTGFIQSYYLFQKFGIDYRRATFSSQICNGVVSREQALEMLKSPPYNDDSIRRQKNYIAKKLEISLDEFESIINLPPHWYTDYPNSEKLLGHAYDLYRKIYKKEKLGSF